MAFNSLQNWFFLVLKKQIIYFKMQADYTSGIPDILGVALFSLYFELHGKRIFSLQAQTASPWMFKMNDF